MRKTEVYQIRIGSEEKQQAFTVFEQLGISPAQAIRLFFKQVVQTQSIPFHIQQHPKAQINEHQPMPVTAPQHLDDQDAQLFAALDALLEHKSH